MDELMRRVRVNISGRVQGVCFRECTRNEASKLNVGGYVRNLADGRVEAVIEGPTDQVQLLLDYVGHGPIHARVSNVEVTEEEPIGEFQQFLVIR